jgi:hypothetical protein
MEPNRTFGTGYEGVLKRGQKESQVSRQPRKSENMEHRRLLIELKQT